MTLKVWKCLENNWLKNNRQSHKMDYMLFSNIIDKNTKFGEIQIEIVTFKRNKKFLRKVVSLLWDPHSSKFILFWYLFQKNTEAVEIWHIIGFRAWVAHNGSPSG